LIGGLDNVVGLVDPGSERLVADRVELLAEELVQRADQLVRPPALIVAPNDYALDPQVTQHPPTVGRVSVEQSPMETLT